MKNAWLVLTLAVSVVPEIGAAAGELPTPIEAAADLAPASAGARLIDLPTAMRLAGARNLEVQLAAEKAELARAEHAAARQQLYPWFTVGAAFRRHWGVAQAVEGPIVEADKSALDAAIAIRMQLDFGEARYNSLVASQLAQAAVHASEVERQDSILEAAAGYFDLVRAQAVAVAAEESTRVSRDYAGQVAAAADAGIAFRGDAFRAQAQAEQDRITQRRAQEQITLAAARLSARLHLDPSVELVAVDEIPVPISIVPLDQPASAWMGQALGDRPELRSSDARREAARIDREAAKYAPLYPSLGVMGSLGTLGGGKNGSLDDFDRTSDVAVTLGWRVGPGGLFDRPRSDAAASRLRSAGLADEQVRELILLQVAEAHARARSLADQIESSRRALTAAEETLRLSRERQEFAVGIVAETLLAAQDAARARQNHLSLVAEFNKAQFVLRRAAGQAEE